MSAPTLIGYARVSTREQSIESQESALKAAGCVRVFTDHASGAKASRPGLDAALDYVRAGDVITVVRLDRLGRRTLELLTLVNELEARGVGFKSLTESIDTASASGRLLLHVMAGVAEMERELNRERTLAGLATARAAGRTGGRQPALSADELAAARAAVAEGMPVREVARLHSVGVSTMHRYLARAAAADATQQRDV